jgi:Uma2 family endonuclease
MAAIAAKKRQDVEYVAINMPNGGFTEDEFFEFCQLNDELKIERLSTGQIVLMSLTGSETGSKNAELTGDFIIWNRKEKLGKVFDSSSGFTLPNSAVRSPDVAWIPHEKWNRLSADQQKKFAPICPDFVCELASNAKQIPDLREKMEEYIDNGCRLGWLIDPFERRTYIYRPNREAEQVAFKETLSGEDIMEGLTVKLTDFMDA